MCVALKNTKVSLLTVTLPHASVSYPALKVTKVSLVTMIPPLPRRGVPTSYRSCPCPGGVSRPRNYRSIAIYSDPAPGQVRCPALQSITIYNDPAPAQVECVTSKVTKVLLFIMILPLSRWGVPPSELPRYRY